MSTERPRKPSFVRYDFVFCFLNGGNCRNAVQVLLSAWDRSGPSPKVTGSRGAGADLQ